MALHSLKTDIHNHTGAMVKHWSTLRADWGLIGTINFENLNTTRIWNELDEAAAFWNVSEKIRVAKRNRTPYKPMSPIQLPLAPIIDSSFGFGTDRTINPICAIDGGDQTAYEFANGHPGGAGLVTYGHVLVEKDKEISKFPSFKEPQLVPAEWWDLYNFALSNFKIKPALPNPSTIRVRQYAAFRRQQCEWLRLSSLIDTVEAGTIILMDGPLKAMFTPPTAFMHYVGKKAARREVIVLGVQKECKIDLWLHFQEYWSLCESSNAWIRPPFPILEAAYRSTTGAESNEYLSLGAKGRGIGFPIGAVLNKQRNYYYIIDFNIYDFQAARPFLNDEFYPETHTKNFPLVTQDRDFISQTLAYVAHYGNHVISLGYPFPCGLIHREVRITEGDVRNAHSQAVASMLPREIRIKDIEAFSEDPRKTLEAF